MQHFHPLGFGVAYRRKDDRLNRTQYYTVVAELRKLFKNPCSQAELNKIVPFGFSLQRQKNGVFFAIKIV